MENSTTLLNTALHLQAKLRSVRGEWLNYKSEHQELYTAREMSELSEEVQQAVNQYASTEKNGRAEIRAAFITAIKKMVDELPVDAPTKDINSTQSRINYAFNQMTYFLN
jgi:hypothetical protein